MRGAVRFRSFWVRPLFVGASIAAVAGSAVAVAATLAAGTPVLVPDHPFAGTSTTCDQLIAQQTAAGSVNFPGSEVEPYVAADPSDPSHLIASFQQDRWNDGGAN